MSNGESNIFAVIVAGGSGSRFGASVPKQYCMLDGQPVIKHTIDRFREIIPSAGLVTVVAPDMEEYLLSLGKSHSFSPGIVVHGGETRWHSVKNGLQALKNIAAPNDIILIHDAARPLFTKGIIERAIKALENGFSGAIPVVLLTDSIRELTGDKNKESVSADRNRFVAVQTPQVFRFKTISEAFELPYSTLFTDEASVMEAAGMGHSLKLVEGDKRNIKITHPVDIEIARILLNAE